MQKVRLADGHPAWVVLGYDAARQALNDPRIPKDMLAALQDNGDVVAEVLPGPEFSRHMLNVDPPVHTRLRRLVSRAFAPSRIAAPKPAIRAIASDLLDELAAAGPDATVDLIEGYAYPLPFEVIGELLGIPQAGRRRLHAWFGVLLTGWAGDPPAEAVQASDGIVAYLRELAGTKRQSPAGDLVSVLVAAGDDALSTQELLSSLFQLIVAGHDTTASLIGNAVVALLDHPGQLQALLADPGQLPAAIDELIRFTAPVPHATFRVTTEPVTLGGVQIPPHEQVLVSLGSANRDPAASQRPTSWTSAAATGPTSGSATGSITAWARPWPARSPGRLGALPGRHPGLRLAAGRMRSPGRMATVWSCAAWSRSPSFSGQTGTRDERPSDPIQTKETPMTITDSPVDNGERARPARSARGAVRRTAKRRSSPGGPAAPGATVPTATPPWPASPGSGPSSSTAPGTSSTSTTPSASPPKTTAPPRWSTCWSAWSGA